METQSLFYETVKAVDDLSKSKQFVNRLCEFLLIDKPDTISPIIEKIKERWDSQQFRGHLFFIISETYMNGTTN
jgi:hypothetical protein